MTIRKLGSQPAEVESLRLFAQVDVGAELGTSTPERATAFVNGLRAGLDTSLMSPSRLHGWRVQAMFQMMLVALGRFELLKFEDSGECYFDEGEGTVKLPDFRLVTDSGEHLVIEVKNVAPKSEMKAGRISLGEFQGLTRYSEMTGARLTFAHYWSAFNLWTLVDSGALSKSAGKMTLTLTEALMANELVDLGDRLIGTTPPLTLTLVADTALERKRVPTEDGHEAIFTVGEVQLSCGGQTIHDETERNIAWTLMAYGSWPAEWTARQDNDGRITHADLIARPPVAEAEEAALEQGFVSVGALSSLYSTMYNAATLGDDGEVLQLGQPVSPGLMANLVPTDYWEGGDRQLPLWVFAVQPATGPSSG
jgi:hypothetical protein